MLLQLSAQFDPRRDVAPWLAGQAPAGALGGSSAGEGWSLLVKESKKCSSPCWLRLVTWGVRLVAC